MLQVTHYHITVWLDIDNHKHISKLMLFLVSCSLSKAQRSLHVNLFPAIMLAPLTAASNRQSVSCRFPASQCAAATMAFLLLQLPTAHRTFPSCCFPRIFPASPQYTVHTNVVGQHSYFLTLTQFSRNCVYLLTQAMWVKCFGKILFEWEIRTLWWAKGGLFPFDFHWYQKSSALP